MKSAIKSIVALAAGFFVVSPVIFPSATMGQTNSPGTNIVTATPEPQLPEGLSPAAQPENKLKPAVLRRAEDGTEMQPFRIKVGEKEYNFAQALKLKPADTNNAAIQISVPFQFRHGALLNSLKDLEYIKKKIAAGEQPWADAFAAMKKSRYADPEYFKKMAVPPAVISCDFSGANDHGSIQEMKDANAAYTQALMWYFTGDVVYAQNAAGILETYAKTVTTHVGKNWYLEAAWAGSVFPLPAELLRSTWPEWKNHQMVGKWFNDVIVPPLHNRIAFGNREFAAINAMMAVGIYNEDLAATYVALNHWMNYIPAYHYLAEDGPAPYLPDYWTPEITPSEDFLLRLNGLNRPKDWTSWIEISRRDWNDTIRRGKFGDDSTGMRKAVQTKNGGVVWNKSPETWLPGYTAETARDFGHVEQSFASEINIAEMAWNQGIDVYTSQAERLTRFMEVQSSLRLGEPPPAGMTAPLVPYGLVATWEIAYNHYVNRAGMTLPKMERIIHIIRQAGPNGIRLPKQNAERDANDPRLWKFPAPFPPLYASGIGEWTGWISSWEFLTHGELDKR